MTLRAFYILLLLPLVSSTSPAKSSTCGRNGYPSAYINGGQTAATNLLYGSALGYILSGTGYGPVLAGCTPNTAVTGLQPPEMQYDIAYNEEGLLTAAVANTSEMGSYEITYEPVPPALQKYAAGSRLRVASVSIQGMDFDRQNATMQYDSTMGRLTRVHWMHWNSTEGTAAPQAPLRMWRHHRPETHVRTGVAWDTWAPSHHPPHAAQRTTQGAAVEVATEGYEYSDPAHPLMPTLYGSDGFLGDSVLAYSYHSDPATGDIINISRSAYATSTACTPACGAGTFCCASAGNQSSTAWCAAKPCAAMGTSFTYKYDMAGGTRQAVSVAVDGHHAQDFEYSAGGALTAIQQEVSKGNTTKLVNMLTTLYTPDGHAKGVIAFVVYPLIPLVFGFTNLEG